MAKRIFLTTASVSPWTVPADWNNNNNSIEVIGAGGGGNGRSGFGGGCGGGGGAYAKISNFVAAIPGVTTVAFQVGNGGPGGSVAGAGTDGTDTWFNGGSFAASSVGGRGGSGGSGLVGGVGGTAGASIGTFRFSGGDGGGRSGILGTGASGGGGAGGLHAAGQSANPTSGNTLSNGGAGDAGFGGGGGVGSSTGAGGTGGNGTEYTSTLGAIGGSGGGGGGSTAFSGGNAGTYGGGGGGSGDSTSAGMSGGAGADGLIVITYEPFYEAGWIRYSANLPAKFGTMFLALGSGTEFAVQAVSTPVPGWLTTLEYRFAKKYPVTEQPFIGYTPRGSVPFAPPAGTPGWQGDFRQQFAKKFPAVEQQFSAIPNVNPPSAVSPQGWRGSYEYGFAKKFPVTEQQFQPPFLRGLVPTAATPQGWQGDFGFKFKKPLSPVLQQFIATRIDQPPTEFYPFFGYSDNSVTLLPLGADQIDFGGLPVQGSVPTEATPQGWQGDFGWKFAKPFPAIEQRFFADMWQGLVPTAATPQGWVGDIGVAFAKPFPAAQQALPGFTPQGLIPTAATPVGGWNITPTLAFKKAMSPVEQQFWAGQLSQPPTAATPQGWQTTLDFNFTKKLPVYLNPWMGYFTGGSVPTEVSPQGWWGYQPTVTLKPVNPVLQQFSAFQPQGLITVQAAFEVDPYIYPGDKKAKAERDRILKDRLPDLDQPYDLRKLSKKQRRQLAELEAKRWAELTAGPSREEKLHEDMQQAIQEVLEKAERKRIDDAKVKGLFAEAPQVGVEASLHASIKVVQELRRQHELDAARKTIQRAKQEALERVELEAEEKERQAQEARKAAIKAKKAKRDAQLMAKYRLKKRREQEQVYDALLNTYSPTKYSDKERAEILESVIDVAKRRK